MSDKLKAEIEAQVKREYRAAYKFEHRSKDLVEDFLQHGDLNLLVLEAKDLIEELANASA